jgi:hypothetical protein
VIPYLHSKNFMPCSIRNSKAFLNLGLTTINVKGIMLRDFKIFRTQKSVCSTQIWYSIGHLGFNYSTVYAKKCLYSSVWIFSLKFHSIFVTLWNYSNFSKFSPKAYKFKAYFKTYVGFDKCPRTSNSERDKKCFSPMPMPKLNFFNQNI